MLFLFQKEFMNKKNCLSRYTLMLSKVFFYHGPQQICYINGCVDTEFLKNFISHTKI